MKKTVVFFDTEVGVNDNKIHDIGAVKDGAVFHSASVGEFCAFFDGARFLCGHNIIHHDLEYMHKASDFRIEYKPIDTLYLSPLLFPKRPYHNLLKDDKLQNDQINDPVNNSINWSGTRAAILNSPIYVRLRRLRGVWINLKKRSNRRRLIFWKRN